MTRGRLSALLLGSGFTALVFETLWVKQLGRVVGVEVHAVTIAVSAFFAGLALGGAVLGRRADRSPSPLRLYAALEGSAVLAGVLSTLALARTAPPFVTLAETFGPLAWTLPFALVGAPAVLMGGTLPALLRASEPTDQRIAHTSGRLYAANTLGAVAGTMATPFMLVPLFGITGTALVAASTGLSLALFAAISARGRLARSAVGRGQMDHPAGVPTSDSVAALAIYGAAGGVALGYEVVWSELLLQFLSTRAHAFAVMLATYLLGLAVGSALFARLVRPRHDPWWSLGLLLAGAAVSSVAGLAVLGPWLPALQSAVGETTLRVTGRETLVLVARFGTASCAMLLLPTIFLGAAFPAAARLSARAESVGAGIGTLAALNTAGGILGTLAAGFLLVPQFGLVRALGTLALVGVGLGAVALVRSGRPGARVVALSLMVSVLALVAVTPRDLLGRLLVEQRGGTLVFYEEGVGGTTAVLEQRPADGTAFRRLYIQGVSNSGDALSSRRYMRLQALLPLVIHPGQPRSALVVGFGTGITAGALLTYPDLETRDVTELLPSVVRAGHLFSGNFDAAHEPALHIRIADGRQDLLRRSDRYDLITLEPPPPSAAGVANLYSRDFYALCRDRLTTGGLMAQWWPLPTQNDEDSRALVRSFLDVFPYTSAWSTELHEVLLVGSLQPIDLDGPRIAARYAVPTVARALAEVGIESPAALLATWVTDRAGLEAFAGDTPPVTDDRPRIEYGAWVRRGEFLRVLPRLLSFETPVPLPPGDPLSREVDEQRRELFGLYQASLLALAGNGREAAAAVREIIALDPFNPYYQWIVNGR